MSESAATAMLASKRGTLSIQQLPNQQPSHQQPQQQSHLQHHLQSQLNQNHYTSSTASVIAAAQHNSPYAGATTDAGLQYVVTAAAASEVTNTGADSGTLLNSIYTIPQPTYTNIVHQTHYQQQQQQQYQYHNYQHQQPSVFAYRADLQTSTEAVVQPTLINDDRPRASSPPMDGGATTNNLVLTSTSSNVISLSADSGFENLLPYQQDHHLYNHSNVFKPNIRYHNHHVSELPGLYAEMIPYRQIDGSTINSSVNRKMPMQRDNNSYANNGQHAATNGAYGHSRWQSAHNNHQLPNARQQCAFNTSGYGNQNHYNSVHKNQYQSHLQKRIAAVATVTTASTTMNDTTQPDQTHVFQTSATSTVSSAPSAPVTLSSSFNQPAFRNYHHPHNSHYQNKQDRPVGYHRHQVVPFNGIRHVNNAVSTGQFKYQLAGNNTTSKPPQTTSRHHGGVCGCNLSSDAQIGGSGMQTTSHSSLASSAQSTESAGNSADTHTIDSPPQAQESVVTSIPEASTSSSRLVSTTSHVYSVGGELMHPTYYSSTSATPASYDGGVRIGRAYYARNVRVCPPPSSLTYDGLFLVQPSLSFATHHYHHSRHPTRAYATHDVRPTTSQHLSEMHPSMNIMIGSMCMIFYITNAIFNSITKHSLSYSAPRPMNPRAPNPQMNRRNMRP